MESTGIGAEVALGDLLGGRLEPAQAARVGAGGEVAGDERQPASAIAPAIRIWRRISATLSSTSSSGAESTVTQRGSPPSDSGNAVSPIRRAADALDRGRDSRR